MTKEKQIEEMVAVLKDYTSEKHIMASVVILEDYAEQIYNAGYRKQSEGQWTYSENKKTMKCTRCRLRMKTYDVRRYCPNCGAKMKGGE